MSDYGPDSFPGTDECSHYCASRQGFGEDKPESPMTIASIIDRAAACGLRPPEWLKWQPKGLPHWRDMRTSTFVAVDAAEAILRDWAVGVMAEAGVCVVSTPDVWWEIAYDKMGYKGSRSLDATDYPSAVYAAFARFVEARERSGK